MNDAPSNAVPAYPTAKTQTPLRVFTAGNYGPDDDWPVEKLRQVVDNWEQHQKPKDPAWAEPPAIFLDAKAIDGIAKPPDIGIGHEADQAYLRWLLDRTDMPAAGWPTDLWLDGDALYATLDGVPEEVASLINGGMLAYCSAEFHRDYTDTAGNHYGPALRRISLIGGEPPRSKGNGRIPPMIYSESPAVGATSRLHLVSCFSEGVGMDRATMIAALQAVGFDTTKITDVVPDEVLAEMVRAAQALKEASSTPSTMADPKKVDPNKPPSQFAEDTLDPKKVDPNKPPSQFAEDTLDPKKADPKKAETFAEGEQEKKMAAFTERRISAAVAAALAPVAAQVQTLTAQLAGMGRQVAQANSNTTAKDRARDKAEIATFCERMVKEGRLEPSRLDPRVGPTEADIILALDQGIATFGEKRISPRQAYMDQLAARPPIRTFSERMADPMVGTGGSAVSESRANELLSQSRLGQIALKRREAAKNN